MIEVEPPRRLRHTERLTMHDDPFTVVTWELEPVGGQTRVTLRHTGWPEDTKQLDQIDGTWATILPELKRLLETGDISRRLKARATWPSTPSCGAMPGRTKTENVPAPPP